MRYLITGLAALGLAACATSTPYAPALDGSKGYSEQQIESNRYSLSFEGNSLTDRETVETYLLYRAAELTDQNGYDHFYVVKRDTDKETELRSTGFHDPYCAHFGLSYSFYHPRRGWYGRYDPFWDDVRLKEVSEYKATAEIVLGKGEKPSDPAYFDADEVLANLASKIERPAPKN